MKLLVFVSALLISTVSFASDLGFVAHIGGSDNIAVENTTVALSSFTTRTIAPEGRYMELHLSAPTATYYYRIDGLTTNTTSQGFPVLNAVPVVIKVLKGNTVAIQSGPGAAAETLRAVKVTAK